MASHSKIALWAGSNAACPQGSPTTDSFKATLNKSQVSTRRASWIGDVCGVTNPHMARICALRRLPHSGRATIAVPVQRSLDPRSHTGRRVASKATFRKSTGPSPGTTRLALGAKHPVGKPCSALASFFNRFALAGEGVHTISSAAHCFDSLAYPDCSILEADDHADTQCSAQ